MKVKYNTTILAVALSLILPAYVGSTPQLQFVKGIEGEISFLVDKDYKCTIQIGEKDPKSIQLMALLNIEGTLVTSLTCDNCNSKLYNVTQMSEEEQLKQLMNSTQPYPMPGITMNFEGLIVKDKICLDEIDASQTCTPPQSIEDAYNIFVIEKQYTGQAQLYDPGFFGLTPGQKGWTLSEYLKKNKFIGQNTVSLTRQASNNTLISFGAAQAILNQTDYDNQNGNDFWNFKLDEVSISDDYVVNKHPVKAVLVNSYPYIMYQTADKVLGTKFADKMNQSYPGITIQNNNGAISGKFLNKRCEDLKISLNNLTLTTQYDTGFSLNIEPRKLFINTHDDTCVFAFTMLLTNDVKEDYLMLGQAFLQSYNLSMAFDSKKIGFQGYVSSANSRPIDPNTRVPVWAVVIGFIAALAIVAGIVFYFMRKRKEQLKQDLEQSQKALL